MTLKTESHQDLLVWKKSMDLVDILTKNFPKEELYSLTDQVRRSSRSIGAQIAEAWGKRKYEKHFVSKLTDADAEQLETQHWIETALDCLYVSSEIAAGLLQKCTSIGKMLNSMMSKSELFCGKLITKTDQPDHHDNNRLPNTIH